MSVPSFQLSKVGGTWWATASLPDGGKAVRIDCGKGERAAAHAVARRKLAKKIEMSRISRKRWADFHALRAAGGDPWKMPTDPRIPLPPAGEQLDDPAEPQHDDQKTPRDRPAPAPRPHDDERAREIAHKLRGLGDGQPIEPDEVISPSDEGSDTHDADNEAGDLLAEALAVGIVAGHCRLITRSLRKRKPPERPGESADRWLDWEKQGLQLGLQKLLGKAGTLGPVGKCLVGAAGVTISMYWGSEVIEDDLPAAAATTPPPAHANGVAKPTPPPPTPPAPAPAPVPPGPSSARSEDILPGTPPTTARAALGVF